MVAEEFIAIWNSCDSASEAADRTGYKRSSCMAIASQLRRRGHATKVMKRKVSKRAKSSAQLWIEENQGKHFCGCGCGEAILIQIHHHVRGIPQFVNGHVSRVENPMEGMCGDLNPNFKTGKYINRSGYVLVLIPGPGRSQYILEHRMVMERHLGRKLHDEEVVHHVNMDKQDNRIENLQLMSNSEHTSLHAVRGDVGFGMKGGGSKCRVAAQL